MTTLLYGEVDSLFLKAIFLLHSKSADSAQQLQDLLHDYKEKTYGFSKVRNVSSFKYEIIKTYFRLVTFSFIFLFS